MDVEMGAGGVPACKPSRREANRIAGWRPAAELGDAGEIGHGYLSHCHTFLLWSTTG
jgi:hypothetical protein